MKNSHSFFLRYLSIALMSFCAAVQAQEISLEAASEGLKEARELCSSIGEQEKRLAKTAGYDLDKLCGSLDLIEFPGSERPEEPLVTPRQDKQSPSASTQSNPDKQTQPQKRLKIGSLQPFGYDLFAGEPSDFEQASRIPVSPDYLLGPGDTIELGFYGKLNDSRSLEISRDGSIDFPHLGPINLAGMTYTISALSTITNALFLSGGLSDIASLRNLQLKRGGKLIATLDLYDLLLSGDTFEDTRLQSGDARYIPKVKKSRLSG
jgi:polysaccharide export outer membrane protein